MFDSSICLTSSIPHIQLSSGHTELFYSKKGGEVYFYTVYQSPGKFDQWMANIHIFVLTNSKKVIIINNCLTVQPHVDKVY